MTQRQARARRSELSTPASSEKMMAKAAEGDADLVFLDLEDAVAPAQKDLARGQAARALGTLDWGRKTRAVRVNGIETTWCHDDVVHVVSEAGRFLDVLIVPKVREPRDVWYIDTLVTQLERSNGLPVGRIGLEILIEEAGALARVDEIAACSERVEALILGVADLSGSLGRLSPHVAASPRYPGDMWHYARARMIVAAKVNGLAAIDGPYADFRDASGYLDQARAAAELGADGKWAIHPAQIALANEVFAPSAEDIENATRVVEAVRSAEAAGQGAAQVGGVMIDAANIRISEAVLERAALLG